MHLGRDPAKRVSEWQALLASAGLILVLQVKPRAHLLHWIWEFVQKKKKKKHCVYQEIASFSSETRPVYQFKSFNAVPSYSW